jgi:hypothetical protein
LRKTNLAEESIRRTRACQPPAKSISTLKKPIKGENRKVSFLDNLENNLKALEGREEGGLDSSGRRARERRRALAAAPWAEKLKKSPWCGTLMQQATRAGFQRRMRVSLVWLDTTLRLEAKDSRLDLRPEPGGIVAVFLRGREEVGNHPVDLGEDPRSLVEEWMAMLDAQKALDDAAAAAALADVEE